METILKYFAIPFNTPTYGLKNDYLNKIIPMGDIVAEELQDPNSATSHFLNSLRKTSICSSSSTYTWSMRYKPGTVPKNTLENHVLKL
jgi:hypothetical protein